LVEASELTKRYGPFTAVKRISFVIPQGQVVGFIGPNGAGKTSTMRMLTGFLPSSEGRAIVAGHDVFEEPLKVKAKVGYLPETPPLYTELTVGRYLSFVAEIRRVPRSKRLGRVGVVMEQVGLTGWEDRIIGSLSKGYRQRVGIAQALVHEPEVLILDEPTSGLDPVQTEGVRKLIKALSGERTVILSTHILREVEALCSRVIVIDQGSIAADGSLNEVREAAGGMHYRLRVEGPDGPFADIGTVAAQVAELECVGRVEPLPDGRIAVWSSVDPRPELAAFAVARNWKLFQLEQHLPTLEEAFLRLVRAEK
jgi:ABC-2 type transport system ATP-binding protein